MLIFGSAKDKGKSIFNRKIILRNASPEDVNLNDGGVYVLEGNYQNRSSVLELSLSLRHWPDNKTVSWTGIIRSPEDQIKVYSHNIVFEGFSSEELSELEKVFTNFCGYDSHSLKHLRNRRAEYIYTTISDSAKLTNNLRKMSVELEFQTRMQIRDRKYFVRKVEKRTETHQWKK